jgi:cystathionine beta-lyase
MVSKGGAQASELRRAFDALRAEDLRRSNRIKWTLHGADVLPAWVADMDFPVAPPIQHALQELILASDLGYHHVPLSPRLRAAVVSHMAERFSFAIEPRRVKPLVNVVQGLDASVMLHSEPGDGVVVMTPIYPPFLAAVERGGRRLVESPLARTEERYEIDFDRLAASVDPDTRVLLLCNPHNPTGRVFDRSELETLGEIALRHDLVVVSDEIHAELVYPGHRHIPIASLAPEIEHRTITLTAATKAFNIAGVPSAFAIFGSDEMAEPFRELPPHLLGHCGILDDAATHAAWTEGQPWLDEVMAYLLENRSLVLEFLARELPEVRVLAPEATYLAWLDCRELDLPADPHVFFLEQAKVALSPGRDFGTPGEGFVRLNFATSKTILTEILERMAKAVRE